MRKVATFVGVFLLLIQYFFGWIYAYEREHDQVNEYIQPAEDSIPSSEESTTDKESFYEEISLPSEEDMENVLDQDIVEPDGIDDIPNDIQQDDGISSPATESVNHEPIQTTKNMQSTSLPLLIISEVYFAGTDERFEIYNPHDTAFFGSIQVSGAKSSIITINNLSIPAKTARIFGDNMLMIADASVIEKSALALNIVDTVAIAMDLLFNGEIIDSFLADTQTMANANKTPRASFQRTLDNIQTVHIAPVIHNYNNTDPTAYTINPGIVYNSLQQTAPDPCENRGSTIQIREIFWGNDEHAPYVELFTTQPYLQNINFGGTQLTQDFMVTIDQPAGHYHIVTVTEDDYNIHPYTTDNQKLSFSSELGNIVLYGQSGQVLDKVDILLREDGYSSYVGGQGCQRQANSIDNFSPGFARSYLSYFPQGPEKIITITEQVIVPATGSSTSIDQETGSINAIATGDFVMEIVFVDYDPPGTDTNRESIVLRSLVDYPVDLSAYALRLNTRNGLQYLWGILEPDEQTTLTGNFRFPNAGACIDLLYGEFILDNYCYPLAGSGPGEIEYDFSDVSITIDHLNYDPPGDDTHNEEITFTVHSGIVDFGHGFYVLINGRKYHLTPFAGPRTGTFVLKANYRMSNTQDTCVSLLYNDFVFDTHCYVINKASGGSNNTIVYEQRFDYAIRIDHIEYDPPGLDLYNEKITLTMTNGSSIDLSQLHILINGTKKKLKNTLQVGVPLTLTDNYGFPNNKQTCVVLQYKDHVYDSYCYDPAQDKKQGQIDKQRSGSITIDHIDYDPPGNDTDREELYLSINGPSIDFSQGRYLLINTTKKSLLSYGMIDQGSNILTGTFAFPNSKDTCVSIRQFDRQYDEYCYQIGQQSKNISYTGIRIDITAVLPNPIGADAGKEWIEILLHSPSEIDLSDGFSLLINKSKKSITGILAHGEKYRITGTFALPNAASCIALTYYDTIVDTFCYPQTKEGVVYSKNNKEMLALTDSELLLLKNTTLTKFDNKICLTLSVVTIKCRAIPAGKLASKQFEELKLSRNYIDMMHDYLYNHRQVLYFNTDIFAYRNLFDATKKDIGNGKFVWVYGSEKIPIADIHIRFRLQYGQPLLQHIQGQIATLLFSPELRTNYKQAKEMYYTVIQ